MKKIDIHVHCTSRSNEHIKGNSLITADEMIESMDDRNVSKSVIMSMSQYPEDLMSNQELYEITQVNNRFYYMMDVDPKSDIRKIMIEEKKKGAIGVGEFVYNAAFDSEEIQSILSIAEELNLPVLFHLSPKIGDYYGVYDKKGLPLLESMLEKYPNLIFIGHSQAFWCEISEYDETSPEYRDSYPSGDVTEGRVAKLMRKHDNLYADLSANSGSNAIMRDKEYGIQFLKEFSDRLIFGTDIYNKDQYFPLDDYLMELNEEDLIDKSILENIYYKNFERVFDIKV